MNKKKRVPTTGDPAAWNKPFAALLGPNPTPAAIPAVSDAPRDAKSIPPKARGRVDILRQTAHRGGKTVTVIAGFTSISAVEMKALAKKIQSACGAGGTVKEGRIEIQGDHRETVAEILTAAGFRPVFAGG